MTEAPPTSGHAPDRAAAPVTPERLADGQGHLVDGQEHLADGQGHLVDGQEHLVDARAVTLWRVSGTIRAVLLALAGLVGIALLLAYRPLGPRWTGPAALAVVLFAVTRVVLAVVWPPLSYRRLRWRLEPAAIHIRRGVLWRSHVTVPRTRVQHTDVSRGPLERMFGLASLVIFTAGTEHSEVRLGGLRHETAAAVRDFLIATESPDGR